MEVLDLLVLGSGVAGLSAAVRAAELHGMRVGVLTKGELQQATTRWAQGGVAAVLAGDPDSTDLHLADTLAAGAGLCDGEAVRILVDEGPARVHELIALGATFDRDPDGTLQLAREGGHSLPRVVHAGGAATGAEIERTLVDAVRSTAAAVHEGSFALDLVIEGGRCVGVVAADAAGVRREVRAANVLLATGGFGQLFAVTTNPPEATGDGVAMALRAGVAVADVEFEQFHPTALHHPAMPRPLLSEALRGHGALLRDAAGERFVDELLSRDKVSRAILARVLEQGIDHVWLDATGLEAFAERFPTIAAELARMGLDPAVDWLPVAPAAHYSCGGVVTDLDGAASLPGLWAAGEVACNGVHGANRLASNSLLDGMVFGPRVVEAIDKGIDGPATTGAMRAVLADADAGGARGIPGRRLATAPSGRVGGGTVTRGQLQRTMTADAGVLRSRASLERALEACANVEVGDGPAGWELANLATVGEVLCLAALEREESRGAHSRAEFPDADPALRLRLGNLTGTMAVADPYLLAVREAVTRALAEDLAPLGDLTSALLPPDASATAHFIPRHPGIVAGTACATEAFAQLDPSVEVSWTGVDGTVATPGVPFGSVTGPLAAILTGERTALNFLCHLSGVATRTRQFADAARRGGAARIWDTRKTTPGLRTLEKAAVRAGGATNHRANLSDWVMFKDNHLAVLGIAEGVAAAKVTWPGRMVHVEAGDLDELQQALDAGADAVLLDNMTPEQATAAVALAEDWAAVHGHRPLLECSGGITIETAAAYAATGVDLLSTSQITQSAPALDIGLDIL